jgi:hypothetical protein
MHDDPRRFPLTWPTGWKRTPTAERRRAPFGSVRRGGAGEYAGKHQLTVAVASDRLQQELDRLADVSHIVLSTNVELRLDGRPRSPDAEPRDVGAAVYFRLDDKPLAFACDKWDRVADNIGAIAAHLEALRAQERYGVGTTAQAFAGYAALPPEAGADWWLILGVTAAAAPEQVEEAFRRLARQAHPDVGGDPAVMARLNTARDAYYKAHLGGR